MKLLALAAAGAIAVATVAVPAAAEEGSFRARTGDLVGVPAGTFGMRHDMRTGCMTFGNECRRLRSRGGQTDVVMDWYGGEWAEYNNRSWNSDSYNDWWHDRPDRAYPAWMHHNQDCQRMWFAGDTLRC